MLPLNGPTRLDTVCVLSRQAAAISALEALKKPCSVDLTTDSQYVRQGITSWIHNWKLNGWKTADKKPVKNVDLWQRLDDALKQHDVRWHWIKGHAGHKENERADELIQVKFDGKMSPSSAGHIVINSDLTGEGSSIRLYGIRVLPGS